MTPLRARLASFRRRYYQIEIIRGLLLLVLVAGSAFFLLSVSEGLLWLGTSVRAIGFFVCLLLGLTIFSWYVVRPVLALLRAQASLPDEEVAKLIGRHFPQVSDRLLNTLQLEQDAGTSALVQRAIEERHKQLLPIPFLRAIDVRVNWRLLRYIAGLAVVVAVVLLVNPTVVSQGTYRLVRFSQPFQKPAPYQVLVRGVPDTVLANQDVSLIIHLTGKELPTELFLYRRQYPTGEFFRVNLSTSGDGYQYQFEDVTETTEFFIGNDVHRSDVYRFVVLRRPATPRFTLTLTFPSYTSLPPITLPMGQGDVSMLRGTRLTWKLAEVTPSDSTFFVSSGTRLPATDTYQVIGYQSFSYSFDCVSPEGVPDTDTLAYRVQVIPDRSPTVYIIDPQQSEAELPFNGRLPVEAVAEDDFLVARAELRFRAVQSDSLLTDTNWQVRPLQPVSSSEGKWVVEALLDASTQLSKAGDVLEYTIRVWDNDAVSGPKFAETPVYRVVYKRPESQYDSFAESSEQVRSDLESLTEQAKAVREEIEAYRKRLLEKRELSYEDKEELKQLLEKQAALQEQIEEARDKLEQQLEQAKQNQLLGKQTEQDLEKLDDYLEQLQDPEYQEFLRDLQQQLDNVNKRMLQQLLENLDQDNQTMEQALERTLELYKQWQANQKAEEIQNRLQNLQQRQEILRQQVEQAKTDAELQQLAERQQELANEMSQLQEQLEQLQQLKEQTQLPQNKTIDSLQQTAQEVQQQQQQSSQQLQQGRKDKATKAQDSALRQMQQMQQQLQQMQQQGQSQQTQENYDDLRMLLENLLKLSFEQEKLRDELSMLHYNDPSLLTKVQLQSKLRDDMQVIDDSLVALAKRVIQIEGYVLDELKAIRQNMKRSLDYLTEKQISRASASQHDVMTHLNNLANLLVESLTQLQDQLNQQQNGGQPQPNPNGRPNLQQLIQLQQQLNQQLQQQPSQMSPEQRAAFAQQQEEIRQRLQQLYDELDGKQGAGGLRKALEEMEQSAEELRKQGITTETQLRQQQILNRLLDYEKAVREEEYDNKRKGKSADDTLGKRPDEWDKTSYDQQLRREELRVARLRYQAYYQQLIDAYFGAIRF